MKKKYIINSPEEMIKLGHEIGKLLKPNMVIAMNGDLGAGKTTMTKGIATGLNITKIINSPTFTLMKIYNGRLDLYHLDVYRIENPLVDFELEEYFDMDGVCVIEWASHVKALLPEEFLEIDIIDNGDNQRVVSISSYGNVYNELLNEVKI